MTREAAGEPESGLAVWIKEHKVHFELSAVKETVKGLGAQHTGHSLKLFGRVPAGAREDAVAAARNIYARLYTLAAEAVQSLPAGAVVQVEPPGRAVVTFDPQAVVEVELTIVASPPGREGRLPPAEERRLIGQVEARLRSAGLRKSR